MSDQYAFQEETGANGTPHLQGCIRFEHQKTFTAMKELMPTAHIEKCKNWKQAVLYCQKEDTRTGKCYTKGVKRKVKIIDPITKYSDWQQEVVDIIEGPVNPREVIWIVDTVGGKGKTSLAKHLVLTRNALVVSGKASDIKYGVAQRIERDGYVDIVVLDIPRTNEGYVSYQAIEKIKDGLFFTTKYESDMCAFNSPHLIVFSNFHPDESKISQDRWRIIVL